MAETSEAIIAKLAKMPCPLGDGHYIGSPFDGTTAWESCAACKGTGALFPWLREHCLYDGDHVNDGKCHRGWLPRLDISLEDAIAELKPVDLRFRSRSELWIVYCRLHEDELDTWGDGHSPREAFWRAVEKALI